MLPKIKLITDSGADLPELYKERYQIKVVPLTVIFGEQEFKDQVTMSREQFWEKLFISKELPSTNQANPHEFVKVFQPYLEQDYTILYVGLSSQLSGTLQSANLAKEILKSSRIHVFDSRTASLGVSLFLIKAGEMIRQEKSIDEIWKQLDQERTESSAYFILDSLTHLVKGGRLSRAQGVFGTVLNIKPVLQVTPKGTIEVIERVRSTKKALQTIVAKAKEQKIDFRKKRVAVAHTPDDDKAADLIAIIEKELEPLEIVRGLIGPTIGTHAGPGGLGLLF